MMDRKEKLIQEYINKCLEHYDLDMLMELARDSIYKSIDKETILVSELKAMIKELSE